MGWASAPGVADEKSPGVAGERSPGVAGERSPGVAGAKCTLALDASTYVGTVAVLRGDALVADAEVLMRGEHEERLMPGVVATLAAGGYSVRDVERIVCGAGPGSFTSLRIAGSIAKGIAVGNGVPLYEVNSLALVVAGQADTLAVGRYLATINAMRGERFAALFEVGIDGAVRELERLGRLSDSASDEICTARGAVAIGPGELPARGPHARGVARLLAGVLAKGAVSLDSWEPDYGRDAEAQVKWEAAHGRRLPR